MRIFEGNEASWQFISNTYWSMEINMSCLLGCEFQDKNAIQIGKMITRLYINIIKIKLVCYDKLRRFKKITNYIASITLYRDESMQMLAEK